MLSWKISFLLFRSTAHESIEILLYYFGYKRSALLKQFGGITAATIVTKYETHVEHTFNEIEELSFCFSTMESANWMADSE